MLVDNAEAVAFAAVLQSLRDGSVLPLRRPSYQEPTFWTRPLTRTALEVLAPTATWVPIITLTPPPQYVHLIQAISFATLEPLASPGVEFRLQLQGSEYPNVTYPPGIDICKPATWPPLEQRPFSQAVPENFQFTLEARNLGVLPRMVLAGIYGWTYPTVEIELGRMQGITDA